MTQNFLRIIYITTDFHTDIELGPKFQFKLNIKHFCSAEKDLGILVDMLAMSQQYALLDQKAKGILVCTIRSMASRSSKGILPCLLCPGQALPETLHPVLGSLVLKSQGGCGFPFSGDI